MNRQTFTNAEKLKDTIVATAGGTTPFLIAVDGFGGSGKSTLCKQLVALLGDSVVVRTDDFIKSPHEPNVFDHDWDTVENKVLKRAKSAKDIVVKTYDWNTLQGIDDQTKSVTKYIIVDGIGLLRPQYAAYFDLKIWIDCPYEVALERCKKRDRDNGANHDELWDTVWGPGSLSYFNDVKPNERADVLFKTD